MMLPVSDLGSLLQVLFYPIISFILYPSDLQSSKSDGETPQHEKITTDGKDKPTIYHFPFSLADS